MTEDRPPHAGHAAQTIGPAISLRSPGMDRLDRRRVRRHNFVATLGMVVSMLLLLMLAAALLELIIHG